MNLRSLYVKQIPNSSPRAIAFGAMQGVERDVLVFNLYSGQMCVYGGGEGLRADLSCSRHIIRCSEIVGKWNVGAYMWVKVT